MNLNRIIISASLLAGNMTSPPAFADIETTTVKTTTVPISGGTQVVTEKSTTVPVIGGTQTTTTRTTTTSPATIAAGTVVTTNVVPFVLPNTSTYFVIDPFTGKVIGNYDPTTGLADINLLQPGLIVISAQSGQIIAALDANGRPVEIAVAPAVDPFVAAIDARRAKIETMIADCVSRGTMDAAEAVALRKELNRIEAEEINGKQSTGVLSYSKALQIAIDLNDLETRLKPFMPTGEYTPLIAARIVTANGQLIILDDTEYRQTKLSQRVDDDYNAGRLSAQQVSILKDELNNISALKSKYMKNGQLSESNKKRIMSKLDSVETRLNQDVAQINAKRSRLGLKVD